MAVNSHRAGNDRGLINVVVARFSAIGDVAMAVPVIYSACRCYPDVRFYFITRQAMTGIFVNPPANLTLIGLDLKTDYVGLSGMKRIVGEVCRDVRADCFLDLHNVLRTKMMRFFFHTRRVRTHTIRKGKSHKHALTRRYFKKMLPLISQRARYREVFFKAGLPVEDRFNGLYDGHAKADPQIFSAICPPKPDGRKWIGIAPYAAHKGKIYPIDMMESVVAALSGQRSDVTVFLFGGGGAERDELERWAARYPNVVSLAGKRYGFDRELALINHLDVMVTMDSANMHLATIASTPTVSIWGATHHYCGFKGWRQDESDIIQLPMTCRPCSVFGNKPCHRGDYMCLTAIRPETVYNRIIDKL